MAARKIFKVFLKAGKWRVSEDGKNLGEYQQRDEATQMARDLALDILSSQVLVYRDYGSIEKSFCNFQYPEKKS